MRSQRLPIAPPRISDSPTVVMLNEWLFFQRSAETTIRARIEKLTSAPTFHCTAESANNPNAAPVFCTCVRRKNPGITTTLSCSAMLRATAHLASRSRSRTTIAITKKYLRMKPWCLLQRELPLLDAAARWKEATRLRAALLSPDNRFYRAAAVASISASTALQRSHTVGYVLSSPTCVE